MDGRLRNDVARLLADLEITQHALQTLFQRKRAALKRPQHDELLDVAREETQLVEAMQRHLARRKALLGVAAGAGLPSGSLADVVGAIGGLELQALAARMDRIRENSESLRRESWVQWVVTQRAGRYYADLLELLVHHGQRSPVYSRRTNDTTNAGALLDASA
jgi:FlgN protein